MLTALEIENFKGIAARQRIEGGAADVDRTELGGSVLELGGFARLVHDYEAERAIVRWPQYVHEDGAFDCVDRPVTLVDSNAPGGRGGQ